MSSDECSRWFSREPLGLHWNGLYRSGTHESRATDADAAPKAEDARDLPGRRERVQGLGIHPEKLSGFRNGHEFGSGPDLRFLG
jgi:hypothetical protein